MSCPESAHLLSILSSELDTPVPAGFPSRFMDNGQRKLPDEFAKEYLLYNLVRKLEPFARKTEVPRAVLQKSLTAFSEAEHRCLVINTYGSMWSSIDKADTIYFSEALRLAKSWISRTLMDVWPRWDDVRFTGGASRNCSRKRSLAPLKWDGHAEHGKLSATALALRVVLKEVAPNFGSSWTNRGYEIVDDSRFDFVTKTAETVRFMAMEPELNMLAQGCVGSAFRFALRQQGIDLDSQTLNQQMALLGSIFGTRATLDQTSASDCIAILMANMLPKRYRDWVLDLRTPYTSVDGRKHRLQKIATMGNGFIFELQSLIFAAFTFACTTLSGGRECDIAIYGDDIVCSSCVAPRLMQTLEFYGLIPNMTKSFWDESDPFRESCGKHYFAGRDVTPFYLKEPLVRLKTKFRALNGLWYWQQRTGIAIPDTLRYLVSLIGKADRVVVPPTYSIDSGIHFPVSGCTLPSWYKTHGTLRASFKYLQRRSIDITEKLSDSVRYKDWLANPPMPLIPHEMWEKVIRIIKDKPRSLWWRKDQHVLPGIPREVRVYCCGGPQDEDHVWANGNVARSEIPR